MKNDNSPKYWWEWAKPRKVEPTIGRKTFHRAVFAAIAQERERCAHIAETLCDHAKHGTFCEFGKAPGLIAERIRRKL